MKEWFAAQGLAPVGSTADEFTALIKSETVKWAGIARDAGIKPKAN